MRGVAQLAPLLLTSFCQTKKQQLWQSMKVPKDLFVWGLTIFAAFGGFMFGYDIGIINGVKEMCGFRMTFNLSYSSSGNTSCSQASCSEDISESTILGLIVSVFSLGCLAGALVAGALSDLVGRKLAIMAGGVVFIMGGVLQAAAYSLWMILVGRIIAGVGVGILSMVVPIYNAELAPKTLRGRLVSLNQLAITAGIMVSFLVNLGTKGVLFGWRISLGLQAVLGIILVLGMILLPETPRWLVKKKKNERALKVLTRIRCSDEQDVKDELNEIVSSTKNGSEEGMLNSLIKVFSTWRILQRVLIGVTLQLFQQFTGMNVIMYYSTSIFCQIGVQEYPSTALVGTINFLTTFLSIVLVDKIGRKALLLLGSLGMLVSILLAATIILIWKVGEEESRQAQVAGYIVIIFVCFFVFNFAYGWGPVAWVVTSEIFPLDVRAVSVSITTSANWTGNFVVAMLTPILIASPLHIYGTFYLLSACLLASFLFVLFSLPETKGLSLERIETVFALPWKERTRVLHYLLCGCPWRCCHHRYTPDLPIEVDTSSSEDDKAKLLGNQNTSEHETSN